MNASHHMPTQMPTNIPSGKRKISKVRKKWRKPSGMPKRPLSAYNFFFAEKRKILLKTNNNEDPSTPVSHQGSGGGHTKKKKIGFANLARAVAADWKVLTDAEKQPFAVKAAEEQRKYKLALEEWKRLGLDPRCKASKGKKPSCRENIAEDHVNRGGCETALIESLIMPIDVVSQGQHDTNMICGLAETIFGEPCTDERAEDTISERYEWLQPSPISTHPCAGDRVQAALHVKEKSVQVNFNELSSSLFQKLNRELDDDQTGLLRSPFARSA